MNVQPIIDAGRQFCMMVTGGGQDALGQLTNRGGMSSVLLEASVPYSAGSLADYLGGTPDKAVSPATSLAGSVVAYRRALRFQTTPKPPNGPSPVFGIAATSMLGKRGEERSGREHRSYIAVQTPTETRLYDLKIKPGRTRAWEEGLITRFIYETLMETIGYQSRLPCYLESEDKYTTRRASGLATQYFLVHNSGHCSPPEPSKALFASSCNPFGPHHAAIMQHAAEKLGHPIDLELCVTNPDKSPLDYITIQDRLTQIYEATAGRSWMGQVYLSSTPLFIDKVKLHPNATFVVGSDTMRRFTSDKYGDPDRVLKFLLDSPCRFMVYERAGQPFDCDDLAYGLACKCQQFAGDDLQGYVPTNLSSTSLRNGK